jgi:hypothetical protein
MLLLHGWSMLWGVDSWQDVATTATAYRVRHLGVVVIGLVGLLAVAAAGRVLLRSWRWGLVAAAVLAAVPMWTGHLMVNVKDVPVATGHTLCTLALLLWVSETAPPPRVRLARAGTLTAGLVLTLGTRPGMWTGLAVLLATTLAAVVLVRGRRRAGAPLGELAGSCLVAAVVLVATYPRVFGSPLRALPRTSESSSRFMQTEPADRWYVPQHAWEQIPTLLLAFALLGSGFAAVGLVRGLRPGGDRVVAARLALVGVQAFAVPAAAILLGSPLYHGLRQLLFALPALALLATYGVARWLRAARRPRTRPLVARLVPVLAVTALVLPIADQVLLQPYQTSYVTLGTDLLARDRADDDRPGSDFWRASIPELLEDADLDRVLLCKAATDEVTMVAYPFMNGSGVSSTSRNVDCREEATGPLAPVGLAVVRPAAVSDFDAVFIGALPLNCVALDEVSRWRHGFDVVLATLGRCSIDPPLLTATPVRADDPRIGTAQEGDLWRYATDGWLQWPGRPELTTPAPLAGLALHPDRSCRRSGCALVVEGSAPADLVVTLDGEATPVRRGAGQVVVPLRPDQARGDVWVTLSRRSGEALSVTMTGLRLAAAGDVGGPAAHDVPPTLVRAGEALG